MVETWKFPNVPQTISLEYPSTEILIVARALSLTKSISFLGCGFRISFLQIKQPHGYQ